MQFDIITIFPNIFDSYFSEGIIKRAQKKKLISIKTHDLRKWADDPHKSVDDKPFGGGRGMIMKIEPFAKALKSFKKKGKVVLFTPRGKKFDQKMAYQFSKLDRLILLCGRYEGVDERVTRLADIQLSIGDYVLMGGELAAMVLIESTARLLPGVLGKSELLKERMSLSKGFIEYPQYTRPENFIFKGKSWKAPKVLLSGNHKKIEEWRKKHQRVIEK